MNNDDEQNNQANQQMQQHAMPNKSPLGKGLSALLGEKVALPVGNNNLEATGEDKHVAQPDGVNKSDVKESNNNSIAGNNETLAASGKDAAVSKEKLQLGQQIALIADLYPNPNQPRKIFQQEALQNLAQSIASSGLLQPIAVRQRNNQTGYEIIAGERRWRACQLAGIHEVPIMLVTVDDEDMLVLGLIENLQREDLNIIEEAEGYQRLIDEQGLTQQQISEIIGKSRSHIANILRLLQLPAAVISLLSAGEISVGHGRALIGHDNAVVLAKQAIAKGLSVRQMEKLASKKLRLAAKKEDEAGNVELAPEETSADANTLALANRISEAIGLKTQIFHKDNEGHVQINFTNLLELDVVIERLCDEGQYGGIQDSKK